MRLAHRMIAMDTEVLRWFQLVADGTTLTEVSDIHGVSQPAVSRALDRLASEVGTPLLHKHGRLLRLTRAGASFKRHVDALISDLDDGLAEVEEILDPDGGTVALGFQLSFGSWLVPRLVASFHATHPRVRFSLAQVLDADPYAGVRSGDLDLEITALRPGEPDVSWRQLLIEPLALAVPLGHRLDREGRVKVDLAEASDEDFVMLRPGWSLRQHSEDLCRTAGFEPRVTYEVDDVASMRGLVGAGLAVAVFPSMGRPPAASYAGVVRLVGLRDEGAFREVGLVWSRGRRLLPAAEAFRTHTLDVLANEHLDTSAIMVSRTTATRAPQGAE